MTASTDGSCSMLGMDMHSDGNGQKNLHCLFSGEGNKPLLPDPESSARAAYSNLYMNGTEVFKFAVRTVPTVSAVWYFFQSGSCWVSCRVQPPVVMCKWVLCM